MKTIYEYGIGDALLEPSMHPPAITEYIAAEEQLLLQLMLPYSVVIEGGCSSGRHTAMVLEQGKKYIGIDNVDRYLQQAATTWPAASFICSNITNITPQALPAYANNSNSLMLFPFNLIGALSDPVAALQMLAAGGWPFVLFTFDSTAHATAARLQYYSEAGFTSLHCEQSATGTVFTDEAGLHSTAYTAQWFKEQFKSFGFPFYATHVGEIGKAYYNFQPQV